MLLQSSRAVRHAVATSKVGVGMGSTTAEAALLIRRCACVGVACGVGYAVGGEGTISTRQTTVIGSAGRCIQPARTASRSSLRITAVAPLRGVVVVGTPEDLDAV